jgi:hypothetical protein
MFYLKGKSLSTALAITLAAIMMSACGNSVVNEPLFYAVDSLISSQVKYLAKSAASLNKVSSLNGQSTQSTYAPGDTVAWNKELEIFRQLDQINKPVNRGLYETKTVGDRGKRSMLFRAIEKDLTVEELELIFVDNRLRSMKGRIKEENSMYEAKRLLRMDFDDHDGSALIRSYSLKGGQEIFLGDSVHYDIVATISVSD